MHTIHVIQYILATVTFMICWWICEPICKLPCNLMMPSLKPTFYLYQTKFTMFCLDKFESAFGEKYPNVICHFCSRSHALVN